MEEYQRLNRAMWDSRAARHAASTSYDLDRYRRDPHAISDVVRKVRLKDRTIVVDLPPGLE